MFDFINIDESEQGASAMNVMSFFTDVTHVK